MVFFDPEKFPNTSHRAYARYASHVLAYWQQVGDPLAEALCTLLPNPSAPELLHHIEQGARHDNGMLQTFLEHSHTVPDWVNFEQIHTWLDFSKRYASEHDSALLIGAMQTYLVHSPFADLCQHNEQALSQWLNNLLQLQHILHQHKAIEPGSAAHKHLMQMRLQLALWRDAVLRQRRWPSRELGFPLHQVSMALFISLCDHGVALGLRQLGVNMTQDIRESQHHFWRYCAWILGVDEFFLTDTPAESMILWQQILHQKHPEVRAESIALCQQWRQQLQKNTHSFPTPFSSSEAFINAHSRHLLKEELADQLGIRRSFPWQTMMKLNQRLLSQISHLLPHKGQSPF